MHMLNAETRYTMKSLIPINNSQIMKPVSYFSDEFKTIVGKVNYKKLEDSSQFEFGIFDTGNFLNSLDLLENPEIELKDNAIIAKDNTSELKFITSDIDSLDIDVNPKVIDSTLAADTIVEFEIDVPVMTKVKKAKSVFSTFDTLFIQNNNNVKLELGSNDTFSSSNNSFAINILSNDVKVKSDKEFQIALPLDSFLKIPPMKYNFIIKYNEKRDAYRVVLDNTLLTFVMSLRK
jgi:hypothetical protein